MRLHATLVLLATAGAVSCAAKIEPYVQRTMQVQEDVGYVAAFFSVPAGTGHYTFGLVDPVNRQYQLAFRHPGDAPSLLRGYTSASTLVGMIAVPPGDYRVQYWRDGKYGEPIPFGSDEVIARPFSVQAGHVVFLGSFVARSEATATAMKIYQLSTVTPQPIRADEAWQLVSEAYPRFTSAPMECLLCLPPHSEPYAGPVRSGASGFHIEPDVVIHLRRMNEWDSTACHLSAWETYDGKRETREVFGANSNYGMPRAGMDVFGPYWKLNALDFRNGRVNVGVQRCQPVPSGGRLEASWDLAQGREVWIREGDPAVYFSQEAALAATR